MGFGMSMKTTSPPAMKASNRIPSPKPAPLFCCAAALDGEAVSPPAECPWLEYFR
jgi:hypothetical protein